jgi:hypothetical protein
MGLGADFLNILKDSVKLTDSVERLNSAVGGLKDDVHEIDKRLVRLETMVEIAQKQKTLKDDPN